MDSVQEKRPPGRREKGSGIRAVNALNRLRKRTYVFFAEEADFHSHRVVAYLDKHPAWRRFFRRYRRFCFVALTLGAFLTVTGLFGLRFYQSLSDGDMYRVLSEAALPLAADSGSDTLLSGFRPAGLSGWLLSKSVYFPDNIGTSYLFKREAVGNEWGVDWADEGQFLPVQPLIPSDGDSEYQPDAVPEGFCGIRPISLADATMERIGNGTNYDIDLAQYAARRYPIVPVTGSADAPAVLILHTHATECYQTGNASYYDPKNDRTRTGEDTENMVAVGDVLTETLENAGIRCLHLREQFDAASYTEAYTKAAAAIRQALDENPGIVYVFDVHRDSMVQEDGTKLRPLTTVNGQSMAQIMLVVGTDEGGGTHPRWRDNLTVAAHLQQRLINTGAELVRPLNLRSATFNEQYTTGSLLIEIGSTGNTLDEAKRAAAYLGRVLAVMISGGN